MRWKRTTLGAIVVGFVVIACARSNQGASDTSLGGPDTSAAADQGQESETELRAEVERLEQRLRSLAKADGCESTGSCKTVPVGERACGGPREYVIYCATTTDEPALLAVADSLRQAEIKYNTATGAVSTCEYRLPPTVILSGDRCVAGSK